MHYLYLVIIPMCMLVPALDARVGCSRDWQGKTLAQLCGVLRTSLCDRTNDPVCLSSGKDYGNLCMACEVPYRNKHKVARCGECSLRDPIID